MGGLGDGRGAVIAVFFLQRRHQHQRVLEAAFDIVEARLDADDAIIGEGDGCIGQKADRLEEVVGHHWVEDVKLKMALAAGKADGGIVAVNVRADLRDRLALGGVHLARHDGAARLILWQGKFAEAGARARTKEADVVRDLEAGHGDRVDRTMGEDHCVMRGQRLELVRCGAEIEAGDLGDLVGDHRVEALGRGEAGADRRAALCQLHKPGQRALKALNAVGELLGVAGEFLAERDRCGVLSVRAADLDDVGPGLGLGVERVVEFLERRDEAVGDFLGAGDVHGGREGVIGRLRHVAVIIRVHRLLGAHLAAEYLDGAVGDDLIRIHVGLGAGPGLPDDKGEVLIELAVDHFVGGLDDGLAEFLVELAEGHIGFGGRFLDDAERAHDGGGLFFPADLEIAEAALGLCAPVLVARDLDFPHCVGFSAWLCALVAKNAHRVGSCS